ncbi:MAG: anti-sigma factor family protein [Balneola sp.]
MTREEAHILLMDYIYGELDNHQARELELYLETDPELKLEFEELSQTRSMLQHLPVQSPAEQLVIMEPEKEASTASENWWQKLTSLLMPQSSFGKTGFAMATFVFLFFVMGAFTDMNVSFGDGGFKMTFGDQPPVQTGYTAAQVEMIINQVQQENAQMINQYVLAAQEQQELQFQQTLSTFAEYLDSQRESDLELFNYSLTSLEENTYNRFRQTDQVLGEIIQTVSTN